MAFKLVVVLIVDVSVITNNHGVEPGLVFLDKMLFQAMSIAGDRSDVPFPTPVVILFIFVEIFIDVK